MDAYLPALGFAALATASIVLVCRGPPLTRAAVVLVALLPLHAVVVSYVMRTRVCNLINGDCLEGLSTPVDLLWVHVAVASAVVAAALVGGIRRARRPARAPSRAAR